MPTAFCDLLVLPSVQAGGRGKVKKPLDWKLCDQIAAEVLAETTRTDIADALEDEALGPRMAKLRQLLAAQAAGAFHRDSVMPQQWRAAFVDFAPTDAHGEAGEADRRLVALVRAIMELAETRAAQAGVGVEDLVRHSFAAAASDPQVMLSTAARSPLERTGLAAILTLSSIMAVVQSTLRGVAHPTVAQRRHVLAVLKSTTIAAARLVGSAVGYGNLDFVPRTQRLSEADLDLAAERYQLMLASVRRAS
jgi:hypothetical protein